MEYNISVKEYLERVDDKRFDRHGFLTQAITEAKALNSRFHFFRHVEDYEEITFASPLKGLPISVKDNICTKGMLSSAGSKILHNYVPPFDATAVAKVREGGGNIIGKTNQDEFGFGTFSTNCHFATPLNPIDEQRSCGGSSGGAAGFVAASRVPNIALAESTGGSISCPAAFCGVVGLTPTYGLVSRYGLIDYASSLDKIGVISKSVYDAALLLSLIAGHDARDATSLSERKVDYTKHVFAIDDMKGVRIAVPKEYFQRIDKGVSKAVWNAIEKMEELGAKYKEVSLPTTKIALPAYYIIATAEASTNLARYCGIRYGYSHAIKGNYNEYFSEVRTTALGEEAKRRVILGTFVRMAGYRDRYYMKAMQARTLVINDFKRIFKKFDAIAAPTMPMIAPRFKDIAKLTPAKAYQSDVLTVAPNLAGMPQISVPCGSSQGMPVGLHLIGDHLSEAKLIEIASMYEYAAKKREKK